MHKAPVQAINQLGGFSFHYEPGHKLAIDMCTVISRTGERTGKVFYYIGQIAGQFWVGVGIDNDWILHELFIASGYRKDEDFTPRLSCLKKN